MLVDDQFVDGYGVLFLGVLYMGIFVYKIGQQVGQVIVDEMKWCGWNLVEVGIIWFVYDQLLIVCECMIGVVDVLKVVGFLVVNVIDVFEMMVDIEGVFNVVNIVFIKYVNFKCWVVFGLNDDMMVGVVCVVEGCGIGVDVMVVVGINGSQIVFNEFVKLKLMGFYGLILLNLCQYGYQMSINMYDWIMKNQVLLLFVLMFGMLFMCDNEKQVCVVFGL